MHRFCRYVLRTTNVAAARAFYAALLGDHGADIEIEPLPEAVAARGAPAHWLGHIGVDDVEAAARAFVERGATRLGPTRPLAGGGEVAIVRDPGGAVVAVATRPPAPAPTSVVWHGLNTTDLARAAACYRDLFGWEITSQLDLGPLGVHQRFTWQSGGADVGSMADIAGRPGVHPHWLFHFHVPALDPALAAVRAAGGLVIAPIELPSGDRIAVCDDPQGAAFALQEVAPRSLG